MYIYRLNRFVVFEIVVKFRVSIFAMYYFQKIIVNFTFSNKIDVLKEENFGFKTLFCESIILNNLFYLKINRHLISLYES